MAAIKPLSHSNEPAEVLARWFHLAASPQEQASVISDAPESDRERLLSAMTDERRALVEPLLRKARK